MKRTLEQLGLEFWLPLPLIAAGIWFGTNWLNLQVMGKTYEPTMPLMAQAQTQITLSLSLTVASMDAEVDREQGQAEVTIQTLDSALQELEFDYPFVEFADIEAALSQDLSVSPEVVREMIRYRIEY